jgi:phospholipid/cholesterol/gamma-HCH transport system ATP-binding protein
MSVSQQIKKSSDVQQRKAVIVIEDLRKSFGDNHVLNGFSMKLYEGENLVIMGKSGSGKSVMIKCLIGLLTSDSGTINVMGKDMSTLNRKSMDELRSDIGFLFQGSALYDSMTVRENLEFSVKAAQEKI